MTVCKKKFSERAICKVCKKKPSGNKNLQKIAKNNNFHKACQE